MNRRAPYSYMSWQTLLITGLIASFAMLRQQHAGLAVIQGFGLLVWVATMRFRKHLIAVQLQGTAIVWLILELLNMLVTRHGRTDPPGSILGWASLGVLELLLLFPFVRLYRAAAHRELRPA